MTQPLEVWMVFDVIAAQEEAARESLQNHLEMLEGERGVSSFTAEVEDVREVDQPSPGIESGYSRVAEVEMEVERFSDLVELVINYGPTSVDIQAPERLEMDLRDARDALNAVAQIMHQYVQSGAGGVMVSRPRE